MFTYRTAIFRHTRGFVSCRHARRNDDGAWRFVRAFIGMLPRLCCALCRLCLLYHAACRHTDDDRADDGRAEVVISTVPPHVRDISDSLLKKRACYGACQRLIEA